MKAWEKIKKYVWKIVLWLGSLLAAVFAVLYVRECGEEKTEKCIDRTEEMEADACKKRDEAVSRISSASAREIAEGYGTVCDAIDEGKQRFRARCCNFDN